MGLAQDPGCLLSCQSSSRSDSGQSTAWDGATQSLSMVLAPPHSEQASPGAKPSERSGWTGSRAEMESVGPTGQAAWLWGCVCAHRMLLSLALSRFELCDLGQFTRPL